MRHLRRKESLVLSATLLLIWASLAPLFAPAALAQATTGSITGTVTDANGAVVANAAIIVRNQSTGVESPVFRSTSEGIYNIPSLIPGIYTITVESPNFKRAVYTDVNVRLGENSVIDVALQPGGVAETVTIVAGSEEVIQKDTSQVSASFDSRKVAELPSNVAGHGIDTLALLVPGVTPGFAGATNTNGTALSVNGNRTRSNNFSIDGQDNNDLSIGGPSYFISNQDLVQDFQVITNNFSAQYGRNQGAIVNIVTKAGTNEFHGTGFWFHRDRKLFETLTNIERRGDRDEAPPLLYNVFGGTLGGPIKTDRAFFFGSYQGIRTRETFIGRDLVGRLAILGDELPRLAAAFPNSPGVQTLANFSSASVTNFGSLRPRTDIPDPFDTVLIGGQQFRAAQFEREFAVSTATPFEQEEFTGRGDVKLSNKDSLWARYLFQDGVFKNTLALFDLAQGSDGATADIPYRSQNFGAAWTRQVSSNALNEFRFAYQRLYVDFGGGCEGNGCIPAPADVETALARLTFANILGQNTGASLQPVGPNPGFPQGRQSDTYQFTNNFSFTRGRHQLMAGADIRRILSTSTFLPNVNGTFAFSTADRLVNNTPLTVTLVAGEPKIDYTETDQFYFLQDDWKIRDNFTLNLGLRYEYTGQPINVLHELTTERESDPQRAFFLQSLPLEARTVPKIPADKNNFAPRIGFAYAPRFWRGLLGEDATVIRGGYSIAYDATFYNILVNVQGSAPTVFANLIQDTAGVGLFPLPDAVPTGDKVRALAEAQGLIARNLIDPRFSTQTVVAPDFHSPYAQQWSLGIQRQLNNDNVVEVRYLGTHGVDLFQNRNANPRIDRLINGFSIGGSQFPGFPDLIPSGITPLDCADNPATPFNEGICLGRVQQRGVIISRENSGQSIYHSMQSRYNGRLFNQLSLGASYTFSKALDNASEIFAFQENSIAQHPFNNGRAERSFSGFDRRHVFAMNGIWDIPGFRDQEGVLGHVLGGWQLNGTYILSSGLRYTPVQFFNNFLGSLTYKDPLLGDNLKPFSGNPNADKRTVAINDFDAIILGFAAAPSPTGFYSLNAFNTTGEAVPVTPNDVRYILNMPGAARFFGNPFGDVARNSEIGPRINQINAGFFKNTQITERVRLQFRTEVFNLFNHPNPGVGLASGGTFPNNFLESAGAPGAGFNEFQDIEFGRRIIQFGVRVIF